MPKKLSIDQYGDRIDRLIKLNGPDKAIVAMLNDKHLQICETKIRVEDSDAYAQFLKSPQNRVTSGRLAATTKAVQASRWGQAAPRR